MPNWIKIAAAFRAALAVLALCGASSAGASAEPAATADWRAARVSFAAADTELKSLINDIAAAAGVRAKIDPQLTGSVTYRATNAAVGDVLKTLGGRYAFDWWFDGASLNVTRASAAASRILRFTRVSPDELRRALTAIGLYEPRFAIRVGENGLGFITAPPGYVAAVELVLSDLESAAAARTAEGPADVVVRTIKWGRVGAQRVERGRRE